MAVRVGALRTAGLVVDRSSDKPGVLAPADNLAAGIAPLADLGALCLAAIVCARSAQVGLLTIAMSLAVLLGTGRYGRRRHDRLGSNWSVLVTAGLAPAVVLGLFGSAPSDSLLEGCLASGLLMASTAGTGAVTRSRWAAGRGLSRAIIVGGGQLGRDIASILGSHPSYGLLPVGFVDDIEDIADLPLPHLGSLRSLELAVREHVATEVIVAYGPGRDEQLVPVLRACQELGVNIRVVPRFFEFGAEVSSEEVWGLPLATLRPLPSRSPAWLAKRALDVVVAALALAVTAPVMAVVAVTVKLSSPGPVLFRQERVGRKGKTIQVLKFRSMLVNSDSDITWNVDQDRRVTRVGRIIRTTCLDELPQLFNILKGDMSLVGPRPERPHFVEQFGEEIRSYDDRHRVPGGLTGWAQVHGLRGDTSIVERSRFDNRYIDSWSLGKDLSILARTIPSIVRQVRRGD